MSHVWPLTRIAVDCSHPSPSCRAAASSAQSHALSRGGRRRGPWLPRSSRCYSRLSTFWIPPASKATSKSADDDAHALLVKAGFVHQTHAGIFHMLPLGLRVQQKLETLIEYHMVRAGAVKLSLSTISSPALWASSGRLEGKSELFTFKDRKDSQYLLSPTHEEEITSLLAASVRSYKDLPVRLFQISRKYRDERRPRQGLLRGREFLMKDLYTFDATEEAAHETYNEIRRAYQAIFEDLRVPFLTASADSGSMGGDLSHEYHFPSDKGEDNVLVCNNCGTTMNEEVAIVSPDPSTLRPVAVSAFDTGMWTGISKDRRTLIQAIFPAESFDQHTTRPETINLHAVRAALPDIPLDTGTENPKEIWAAASGTEQIILHDPRLTLPSLPVADIKVRSAAKNDRPILLTSIQASDVCHACRAGRIDVVKAIEVGHTFHLGARYSAPLGLRVRDARDRPAAVHMGCHGIGVSRLVAALAAVRADPRGLQWPAVAAPFCALVVPTRGNEAAAEGVAAEVEAALAFSRGGAGFVRPDVALDDRDRPLGWKLNDADLVGYPVVVVVGRGFADGRVEVQCRQRGVKEEVAVDAAAGAVAGYIDSL